MASSTTIDVDNFEEIDKEDGGMDSLDFQDIPHESPSKDGGQTHQFTNFPHSAADSDEEGEDDQAKLLKDEKRSSSFWTFAYYQQFFDVETKQVGQRILGSMLPRPGRNYLTKQIRPNPDLYGPFWICTTLVFTTAIAGNLANYFSLAGQDYKWKYDFHKVSLAATAIFSYWWLIPLILFGILWWRGSQAKFSFLEIICVYGYSLAIYVPISVLWAIQVSWLQWTLVVLGAVMSGSVLLFTFWPAVSEDNKKIAVAVMIFIFVMHLALAAGFVLYFFHVPAPSTTAPVINNNSTTTLAPTGHPPPKLAPGATQSPGLLNKVNEKSRIPEHQGQSQNEAQKGSQKHSDTQSVPTNKQTEPQEGPGNLPNIPSEVDSKASTDILKKTENSADSALAPQEADSKSSLSTNSETLNENSNEFNPQEAGDTNERQQKSQRRPGSQPESWQAGKSRDSRSNKVLPK